MTRVCTNYLWEEKKIQTQTYQPNLVIKDKMSHTRLSLETITQKQRGRLTGRDEGIKSHPMSLGGAAAPS